MLSQSSQDAVDEAIALRESFGDAALPTAQARLHAAMAARRQPAIDHAISVCRLLLILQSQPLDMSLPELRTGPASLGS